MSSPGRRPDLALQKAPLSGIVTPTMGKAAVLKHTSSGVGLDRLPRTATAIRSGIDERLHLGAQLYVSLDGEVQADAALGEDRPGEPLTPDHLMLWLSATKPVTAVAIAQLWERGLLALDDPVARHIPEFARGGKEGVTLRHALTHTGGFRMLRVGWPETSWEGILGTICERRLEPRWEPGKKAGYHLTSSWFVLGEIIRRLDCRSVDRYLREEIFEPLGARDAWVGIPPERFRDYQDAGRLGRVWNTEGWTPDKGIGRAGDGTPPAHPWHQEARVVRPSPGGNGRGPMRDLGRFYEALLTGGGPLIAPQTVEALTARHRTGLYDHTFQHVMDWGLGFIVDSNQYGADSVPYGYGPHSSRRTFGHSGYRSVVAFADPERRLVAAVAFNGTPGHGQNEARSRAVLGALYEDLFPDLRRARDHEPDPVRVATGARVSERETVHERQTARYREGADRG